MRIIICEIEKLYCFLLFPKQPNKQKALIFKILTNNKAVMSIINHISCGFAKLEFEEAEIIVGLVIHQPKK